MLSVVAETAKENGADERLLRGKMGEAVKDAAVAQAVVEATAEADADAFERCTAAAESERDGIAASLTMPDQVGTPTKGMVSNLLFIAVEAHLHRDIQGGELGR